MVKPKDYDANSLSALNGDRYFIDDKGTFGVIFKVISVAVTPERPHGLKYTLVLIDAKGARVVCFDNAHAVSLGQGSGKDLSRQYDHKHIGNKVSPYTFEDAHSLVADFWKEVDKVGF